MRRFCFLILTFILTFNTYAQDSYLVKTNGDTLYGKVIFLATQTILESVKIKIDKTFQVFKSYQLKSCYVNGTEYRILQFGGKHRIMQLITSGYLSHLKFREEGKNEFRTNYLTKKFQEGIAVSNIGFRSRVTPYLNDCEVIEKGLYEKKYKLSNIEQLVNDYNQLCANESVADTPLAKKKIEFEDLKELELVLSEIFHKKRNKEPIPNTLKAKFKALLEKDLESSFDELLESID